MVTSGPAVSAVTLSAGVVSESEPLTQPGPAAVGAHKEAW